MADKYKTSSLRKRRYNLQGSKWNKDVSFIVLPSYSLYVELEFELSRDLIESAYTHKKI